MGKIKLFLFYLLIFVVSIVFSFILIFSIVNNLYSFGLIDLVVGFIISIGLSTIISIVILTLSIIDMHKKKTSKFFYWIDQQYPKLILGYIIISLFSFSIRKEILWGTQEIQDVLTLIWTIFGLSITIFLVWNVLIVEYLKKNQPKETGEKDLIAKYKLLLDKNSFVQDTKTTYNTVVLLTINLFVILVATSLIYLTKHPESLLTQNITICAFYFSTNTLASLFLDILKPLKKEKIDVLKQNGVSFNEIKIVEDGTQILNTIYTQLLKILSSTDLTDEQKTIIAKKYCDDVLKILNDNSDEQKI